jgi:hypothetical protein
MWNWVQELDRTTRTLAVHGKAAGPDAMTVFWIKLHGTLVEVGNNYEYLCGLMGPVTPTSSRDIRDAHAVRAEITEMRNALNEDQLMWVHYRRDVECHVWQTLYDLRVKDKKVQDHRKFELLGGRKMHVDEFNKRASALLRK